MSEKIKEKAGKALELLDIQRDIERVMPGPSERERQESMLNFAVTGETRPFEHINHESKAFAHANAGIPLLMGFIKGAIKGGRIARAVGAVNETKPKNITKTVVDKATGALKEAPKPEYVSDDFYQRLADLEKGTTKAVEETGKNLRKVAKEVAKEAKDNKPKTIFGKILDMATNPKNGPLSDANIEHAAAKQAQKDLKTAVKEFYKTSTKAPADVLDESMARTAGKSAMWTTIGEKIGKLPPTVVKKKKYEGNLELNGLETAMNILNGIAGEALWNPKRFPMDQVDQLLFMTNSDADVWDEESLENLSDEAKVKLVIDTMHGKYDKYGDVKDTMLKNYLRMTNKDEVHE